MRPVIGIFPLVDDDANSTVRGDYVRSIEKSGGMAVMMPYTKDKDIVDRFVSMCDGFLFTGGFDVDPSRYGEERKESCGESHLLRDEVEFLAFERVFGADTEKPILGICRGSQLVNVALGGTLYQDIPSEIGTELIHRQGKPHSAPSHSANVEKDSPLYALLCENQIPVNSLHHQCVKDVGKGLSVMARATDGVCEALYMPSREFLWLVQWHPERSYDADTRSKKIFDCFIEHCKNNCTKKE